MARNLQAALASSLCAERAADSWQEVGEVQQGDEQQEPGAGEIEEFMSVAAHDLRNPIAVVRASAQMAQRQMARGDPEGALGRLKAIVEQTDRLTDMLETFLDAARVSAGRLPLRSEQVDLREIVEVGRAARARLSWPSTPIARRRVRHSRGVRRRVGPAADRPRGARAGRQRHAVRRSGRAGARRGATPRQSRARDDQRWRAGARRRGGRRTCSSAFTAGRSAAEAGQSGSGLGLFTARGIARSHGGEVRRLEGDRFELELPLTQ